MSVSEHPAAAALRRRSPTGRIAARRAQLEDLERQLEALAPTQAADRIAHLARSAVALADHPTNSLSERLRLLSAAGRLAFEASVLESALVERGLA